MKSNKTPGGLAMTFEDVEAQEAEIDAWAAELDAAAWETYWASEDAEELDELQPLSFSSGADLPSATAGMAPGSTPPDVHFERVDGLPAAIAARVSAGTTLWWFVLILGRSAPVRIPDMFLTSDGTPRARRWGSRSAPPFPLDPGRGGTLLAFCGNKNFLSDHVPSKGLVEVLKAATGRVVLIKKSIRAPA